MARRRSCQIALSLLALFLLGTLVVLSTISFYLKIDNSAYLYKEELDNDASRNLTQRIPKILHQTWKTETLPDKYKTVSQNCRDIMPDYEYMLWTDASSRQFIANEFPWFLSTFDAYTYPIQRADAIRYFILYKYGGVYLDLDIGCTKPLDPLLNYPVILPKTIPVGVSNDLMFIEPQHPFMDQTIHNLITFDHSWILNYPTVMFSTGPMFLSAQYGLYAATHPGEVRILPKSLYGKNAKPDEAPDPFFTHYYGSSWHADDAGFIWFLGTWGKLLMWVGLVILIAGIARMVLARKPRAQRSGRRRLLIGSYDIILPRVSHRNGQFHLDLGSFSSSSTQPSSPVSPISSNPSSPMLGEARLPLLPMYDSEGASSPTSEASHGGFSGSTDLRSSAVRALRNARAWVRSSLGGESVRSRSQRPPGSRRRRSTLFFLPTLFTPSSNPTVRVHDADDVEIPLFRHRSPSSSRPQRPWFTPAAGDSKELRVEDSVLFSTSDDEEDISAGAGTGATARPHTGGAEIPQRSISPVMSRTNSARQLPQITTAPPPYDLGRLQTP